MKYIKILLIAAVASLAFACGKQDYPAFEFGPQDDTTVVKVEVYFPTTYLSEELDPADEIYTIAVARTDATEALAVKLNVSDVAGVFSVPDSVNFDAGSLTATLDIDITKLELETVYDLIISIPVDNSYLYKASSVASSKLSCHLKALKQKWNDAGTCTFVDQLFSATPASVEGVAIQNHEGTNDYRIISPYAKIYGMDEGNIVFSIDQDEDENNVIVFEENKLLNFFPGSGYYFVWNLSSYAAYCYVDDYFDEGEHTFVVGCLVYEGTTLAGAGGFYFTWHDCPVEFPEPAADEGEGEEGGEE